MKRSFRVATVFTGVATCAVALAPTAEAAPTAPGATTTVKPNITPRHCSAGLGPWVHLYYSPGERHTTPACFGGVGASPIAHTRFSSICAGNNYGAVYYSDGTHQLFGSIYGAEWIYPPTGQIGGPVSVVGISIYGHTANYGETCPD
jgi:hypothetical protein